MSRGALPEAVAVRLRDQLGTRIRAARPVGGGCIHRALALDTPSGPVFLKWNRGEPARTFPSEARGLEALRTATGDAGLIRVPRVLAVEGGDPGWLALEYLPPSTPGPDYARRLGQGLALLHGEGGGSADETSPAGATSVAGERSPADASRRVGPTFGWFEGNWIGSLPQPNPALASWPDFWRDARLAPQIRACFDEGRFGDGEAEWTEALLEAVEPALAGIDEEPALVHGDLWSGNVHPGPDGRPVLVDPACYRGAGEVDLAMAQLFGGFDEETFQAYRALRPDPGGWEEVRRPLYQLYFLLVHVRLFGGGYLASTRSAARQVLAAVG